jgi:hypothetical protein
MSSYTQEMQLLSYLANDVAEIVMAYSHDVRYGEDHVKGVLCGMRVDFHHDYISRLSCADFELMFDHKFVVLANDKVANDAAACTPIFTKARFTRGSLDDLRLWRGKLHQFKKIAA